MIRVAVSGAGGKLALPIISAVNDSTDLEISALYNPNRAGEEIDGHVVVGEPAMVGADVVLEASPNDVVMGNLSKWAAAGLAAVVGTSGFTSALLEELRDIWPSATPCLVVPNFSIGAVLMMRFAAEAASHFEAVEIIERHHATKADAPSGTALATARMIESAGGRSADGGTELTQGARGADVGGVRVHALRLPGLISQQEVVLSNAGEVLSISQLSTSYQSFVKGALLAIRHVRNLDGGVHVGLDAVLTP